MSNCEHNACHDNATLELRFTPLDGAQHSTKLCGAHALAMSVVLGRNGVDATTQPIVSDESWRRVENDVSRRLTSMLFGK